MITINFYTDAKKPSAPAAIILQCRYKLGKATHRVRFSTQEMCLPKHFKNQRVYKSVNHAAAINTRLEQIAERTEAAIRQMLAQGEVWTNERIKEAALNIVVRVEHELFTDYDEYLAYRANLKNSTPIAQYRYARGLLKRFSKTGIRVAYDNLNLSFYAAYVAWLRDKEGMKVNTIGAQVQKLKTFLKWARSQKYCTVDLEGWEKMAETVKNIYLTQMELDRLQSVKELPAYLDRVRDLFLFQCEVGCRYGDTVGIGKGVVKSAHGYDLQFIANKTKHRSGDTLTVPLSKAAVAILEKHGWQLPKALSNQKTNDYLKELATLCGIDKNVTTHTARRTFATLRFVEGIAPRLIMPITGHKTEREFFRYICVTDTEAADLMREKGKGRY